ncbi:hypothetical protein B0A55_06593 [Friedmanniomyces simplex]|uniref:C2H2-type domain-containing protein n=1 Tax=Friedmanniomyces simplex TaxID=329884 RepID=A0A4U0XJ44_9PEZI|nr:hypothetical protein B0A55_06593 [Friedmanniomyces simplex]
MNNFANFVAPTPNFALQTSFPTDNTTYGAVDTNSAPPPPYGYWQMHNSMGVPAVPNTPVSYKRLRGHQRTPSASTVASNGPASPYANSTYSNYSHPQIANTDFAPQSPAAFAEQAGQFSKNLPTPIQTPSESLYMGTAYLPSVAAHTGAHEAMKGFAIDHHNGEIAAQFQRSARRSMSGNHSPATPPAGAGEPAHTAQHAPPQNGEAFARVTGVEQGGLLFAYADVAPVNPNVQLWRSESQAYQDELYNPPTTEYAAAPTSASKSTTSYLTPHRNLMTERLQTANLARSHSPTSSISRERSPFRDNSPLAPTRDWRSPAPSVGTAASMRQQQKEQAEQAELAQHRPQLNREPTKTISPKDAVLDYNEQEQPSLFQDSIPAGYKPHTGGTEQWQNNFYGQPGSTFGTLQTPSQQSYVNFRATPADGFAGADAISFVPLPPSEQGQLQNPSYLNTYVAPKMESNPEFPAHLTTMESSVSDNPPPSSQESTANASTIQRPADTRAATGTYTCTYHGCTQRFDSHANLQKHKRDLHRPQHQQHSRDHSGASGAPSSGSASASPPRSTTDDSPGPASSTSGMTSAELMARNSQSGPHKCSRINPSTNKPCNTIFSRPYDLTRHEDTIHNGRKQKVRCPMCREEKTFSRTDALTRHMRVVHPEVESFGKRGKRGV